MSKLKTNTIRHVDGSNDNITLDSSQNVTVEGNATVDGTSTLTGNVTCSGQLKADALRHTGASSDAVTLASDGTCTAKITNNLSNRNLIINGAMQIAQRGTSSTAEGIKTVDRWSYSATSSEVFNTSQHALTSSDTGPWEKGFRHSWHFENGNQGTIAATSYIQPQLKIEAQDIATSGWNIADANSKITLSYWIKSSVEQEFWGFVETGDAPDWMYVFGTGTLSANTWKKVTVTIPGNSNLTVNNDNGLGLLVVPWTVWGSDYTTSGRGTGWLAYASGNRTPDADASWWQTNDATLEVTGVQLEVGDVATDFEHRSYGDELARCQRYFYKEHVTDSIGPYFTQYYHSHKFVHMWYPVTMRTVPTPTVTYNTGSPTAYKLTTNHFKAYVASAYDDSSNTYYISAAQFDAEL